MRAPRFSSLCLSLVLGSACTVVDEEGDDLLLADSEESGSALLPGVTCTNADLCIDGEVRPQCLAGSFERNFGFHASATFDVPRAGQYNFVRLHLRRLFQRTDGRLKVEVKEFASGNPSIDAATTVATGTLAGASISRTGRTVRLDFDSAVTLGTANAATPRYVLVVTVDTDSLSVGLGCVNTPNAYPGGVSAGRKLVRSGASLAPLAWKTASRDLAFAIGFSNTPDPTCSGVPGAECDDGNAVNGDGCSDACLVEPGFQCSGSPSVCTGINECTSGAHACPIGQTCTDTVAGYTCSTSCGTCPPATPYCTTSGCSATLGSCLDHKTATPSAMNGLYTIDPDGPGGAAPYSVFCEMETAQGGWEVAAYLRNSSGWDYSVFGDAGTLGNTSAGFARGANMLAKDRSYGEKIVIYLKLIELGADLGKHWMLDRRLDNTPIPYSAIKTAGGWSYRDSFGYVMMPTNVCTHGCDSFRGYGMFSDSAGSSFYAGTQTGDYGCRDGNNICWSQRSLSCNVGADRCAYLTGAGEGVIYGFR